MNGLDWVVVAILGVSVLSGFARGFVRTVLGLAGWIMAAIVAFRFGDMLGDALLMGIRNPTVRGAIAMVALFLLVGLLAAMIGALVARMVHAVGLGTGDRLLGAFFGAARGVAFVMLATVAAGFTQLPQSGMWRGSFFGPLLESWVLDVRPLLPESLAAYIRFGTEI
jgi:membrane protein required for colicin V production